MSLERVLPREAALAHAAGEWAHPGVCSSRKWLAGTKQKIKKEFMIRRCRCGSARIVRRERVRLRVRSCLCKPGKKREVSVALFHVFSAATWGNQGRCDNTVDNVHLDARAWSSGAGRSCTPSPSDWRPRRRRRAPCRGTPRGSCGLWRSKWRTGGGERGREGTKKQRGHGVGRRRESEWVRAGPWGSRRGWCLVVLGGWWFLLHLRLQRPAPGPSSIFLLASPVPAPGRSWFRLRSPCFPSNHLIPPLLAYAASAASLARCTSATCPPAVRSSTAWSLGRCL